MGMAAKKRRGYPGAARTGGAGAAGEESLLEEIALLREMIYRVRDLAEEAQDLEETLHALEATGAACARLATLLKAQRQIQGGGESAGSVMTEALRAKILELTKDC
jgi:hypothetical protein